ncbi:uncharacterized protein V1516DRAFT_692327 [Lipomyces oligophaga]|uniref:uncharacterized protein n=1 Tax=Lipomyces oligophaga TaxID=45792 RepID=UPI0034CDD446
MSYRRGNYRGGGNNNNRSPRTNTQDTFQTLRTFLFNRYNESAKLLNLSDMFTDPGLATNGPIDKETTREKLFSALMAIAEKEIKVIESVNLANNNIADVSLVTALAQVYPGLVNLSLAGNRITQLKGFDPWRHKFKSLKVLVLQGNPVTGEQNYRAEIVRRFPSLTELDGESVPSMNFPQVDLTPRQQSNGMGIASQSLRTASKLPIATKPWFFSSKEVNEIAMDFTGKFLQMYDQDRAQLMPLYDVMSMFSVCLDTGVPRELTPGERIATPQTLEASAQIRDEYGDVNRNLSRMSNVEQRMNRLAVGPEQISGLLQKLPKTRHDLNTPQKFAIDAWPVKGLRKITDEGLMLIIHGEFEEGDKLDSGPTGGMNSGGGMRGRGRGRARGPQKRSFDRTIMMLVEPEKGQFLVVSDNLTIRPWSGIRSLGWGQ